MLIKGGVIINKWANRCIPDEDQLKAPLNNSPLGRMPANHDVRNTIGLALILIIPLSLLSLSSQSRNKHKLNNIQK
jgi:hypothetical protein